MESKQAVIIENPYLLGAICGPNDQNLNEMSKLLLSPIRVRGNRLLLDTSDEEAIAVFQGFIKRLTEIAEKDHFVSREILKAEFNFMRSTVKTKREYSRSEIRISEKSGSVRPRSLKQATYIEQMKKKDLIFSIGPAGTGKTFLAVAHALMELQSGSKRKIILTRPVVESGENLGFLPGDLTQKLAPYLRPLYDSMEELTSIELTERLKSRGYIELAPLAYMRGRNLKNCCIVLDEAQNTTIEQMKMFLTRLSEGSKAIVTGDLTQVDLPRNRTSGLQDAISVLKDIKDIAFTHFSPEDIVRHALVRKIVDAYEADGGK